MGLSSKEYHISPMLNSMVKHPSYKLIFKEKQSSLKLDFNEKHPLVVLTSTAKHTSQGISTVEQNSIMYYLREKRKLSLT
jgi:hypothetical protein